MLISVVLSPITITGYFLATFSKNCGHCGIIVKTIPAGAVGAASAIDVLDFPDVLGCIAGDDTIFVAASDPEKAQCMAKTLSEMAKI